MLVKRKKRVEAIPVTVVPEPPVAVLTEQGAVERFADLFEDKDTARLEQLARARTARSEQARVSRFAKTGKGTAPLEPPANAAEIVRQASENGCLVGQIATALGVSRTTFGVWRERFPEIDAAYREGHKVEHDALVGKLFAMAMTGNVTAILFSLKARHGYQDTGGVVVENKVSINFQLPAALSPADYVKTIAATSELVPPELGEKFVAVPEVKQALKKEYKNGILERPAE